MPQNKIAEELMAATGCLRTVALVYAKAALDNCRTHPLTAMPRPRNDLGEHFRIKSTLDAGFEELWSLKDNAQTRCDFLNRDLDHPAYFIA
jgi:hypothetical protein